ncbi:MAG: hypothetical protein R3B47_12050 [Bacteroidia bacterium]
MPERRLQIADVYSTSEMGQGLDERIEEGLHDLSMQRRRRSS